MLHLLTLRLVQTPQAKWRGKAQRRSEVDERIRRSLYPEQEDVQRN